MGGSVGRESGKGKIGYKVEEEDEQGKGDKRNKRHCALYVRYLASNQCTGRS